MEKVNLNAKLAQITQAWAPAIVGELNNQFVKLAKLENEYVWHKHDVEDELFFLIDGRLNIELRDRVIELQPGEFFVVPHGVEHRPVALPTASVLLFEPATTINTGDAEANDWTRTPDALDRL
ncbi:MAG: cupin domain-containing protein [Planctomycetota bacterium]